MLNDIIELQQPAKQCPKGTKYSLFLKTCRDILVQMCDELTEQNLRPLTRDSPPFFRFHLYITCVLKLCQKTQEPFICLNC